MKEKNKWDYFMKIAKMAPKKIAETSFLVLISKNIEEISNEYKEKIIRFFNEKWEKKNNDGGKKYYQALINKI